MARKSDGLTPRQRQSQRIMREKAAQKKRKVFWRKFQIVVASITAVVVVSGGLWAWKSGAAARTVESTVAGAYGLTAKAGFAVQTLYLEGRNRTPMEVVERALSVRKGAPILRLSLNAMRERLEQIESIRFASVERELPGTLYVRIIEREPVALWQHEGRVVLVDDKGVVMAGIDRAPYRHLPLIVGADAPQHVGELIDILAAAPELAKKFKAAVRIGERRWNMRLAGGIEVKLPEKNPEIAWKKLAGLQDRQKLLDRNVKVIDLRLEDRLFIRTAPQQAAEQTASAKET